MRLYRIRNKQTGKYFCTGSQMKGNWCNYTWTSSGVFYRKIDTIKKHIQNLAWDNYWDKEAYDRDTAKGRKKDWNFYYHRESHHPERMALLEVVINDVTINGEEIIQAADLIKGKKS